MTPSSRSRGITGVAGALLVVAFIALVRGGGPSGVSSYSGQQTIGGASDGWDVCVLGEALVINLDAASRPDRAQAHVALDACFDLVEALNESGQVDDAGDDDDSAGGP